MKVFLTPDGVEGEQTLLRAIHAMGVGGLSVPCGGGGQCGRCKVKITREFADKVSPLTESEKSALGSEEIQWGYRLACQARILGPLQVELALEPLVPAMNQVGKPSEFRTLAPGTGVLGLAVDLGTTKIDGFLLDLQSGQVLTSGSIQNPQRDYGHDLMSRLAYALEGEQNYTRIRNKTIQAINELAASLAAQSGHGPMDIRRVVVAGNTAMHHLLLGLPVSQLARSPYLPASTAPTELLVSELGIQLSASATLYALPPVAGFVGGDHLAMLVGSGLAQANGKIVLGLDIGTNTEIALRYGQDMLCCSCPSGPAFEGAHILHGMQAVPGAIQSLQLSEDGLEVHWQTVGGAAPLGISGSGMVDAVAELYRTGVINHSGRLNRSHPRVSITEKGLVYFTLVSQDQSGTGQEIVITANDLENILLAKAAIVTGILLLLQEAKLTTQAIQEVVVAGAFGTQLNVANALAIGMFPPITFPLFRQVGNAAGAGAIAILLSPEVRRQSEQLAKELTHVELTKLTDFQRIYLNSLSLPREIGR